MSRLAQKKMEKRIRITNSALKFFNEKGFGNTKIEDIVVDADVGKGTFYLYFKNKEHLVQSVLEDLAKDLLETMEWVSKQISSYNDLRAVFHTHGKRLAETLSRNKQVAIFLSKQARGVSPEIDKMIQEFLDGMVSLCSTHFEQAMKSEMMRHSLSPHLVALSVIGGINFTYEQWACGHVDMDVESIVDVMLGFYLGALGLKNY